MPYWQFSLVTANTARHSALLIPPSERVEISTMREFEPSFWQEGCKQRAKYVVFWRSGEVFAPLRCRSIPVQDENQRNRSTLGPLRSVIITRKRAVKLLQCFLTDTREFDSQRRLELHRAQFPFPCPLSFLHLQKKPRKQLHGPGSASAFPLLPFQTL